MWAVGGEIFCRDVKHNVGTVPQRMSRVGKNLSVDFVLRDEIGFHVELGRSHVGYHFLGVAKQTGSVVDAVHDKDLARGTELLAAGRGSAGASFPGFSALEPLALACSFFVAWLGPT